MRSCAKSKQPLPAPDVEMDYPSVLNRALPDDIRITGWTPVPQDFSARWGKGVLYGDTVAPSMHKDSECRLPCSRASAPGGWDCTAWDVVERACLDRAGLGAIIIVPALGFTCKDVLPICTAGW